MDQLYEIAPTLPSYSLHTKKTLRMRANPKALHLTLGFTISFMTYTLRLWPE